MPLKVPAAAYLKDHCFQGRMVLPAVEAMRILAEAARTRLPEIALDCITNARFDKFLYLRPEDQWIDAFSEIEMDSNGVVTTKLITKSVSPKTTITRMKEHVVLCFANPTPIGTKEPKKKRFRGEPAYEIPIARLYQDLVPFGPAFQNIKKLRLYQNGAEAVIASSLNAPTDEAPLGCPFILDAAFHAACAWAQRHIDIVAFPVGFDYRRIINRTHWGETYEAQISVVQKKSALLVFDIQIYSINGDLCESLTGVYMRDVSGGSLRPPQWIKATASNPHFS